MNLLTLRDASYHFHSKTLLDHAELGLIKQERLALIGRNGTGKSTLLKLIARELELDSGTIEFQKGCVLSYFHQEVADHITGSIFSVVASALKNLEVLLKNYYELSQKKDLSEQDLAQLTEYQHQIEEQHAWHYYQKIETVLSKLNLDGSLAFASLSGGNKRRVLLARALVTEPDLLLLDEPTNHLDMDAIIWLEQFIKSFNGAIIFITHDRTFLQKIATGILDLDRGKLTRFDSDYEKYKIRKEELIETELKQNALFDKKLAEEESWIRQGIKARRTRNEGRVRALKKLRIERGQRREQLGKSSLSLSDIQKSGKLVIDAEQISYAIDDKQIINDFSCLIGRGDKIGIIGPNGCGKTTLIRLLLKKLDPISGSVKHGTQLEIAYFDQLRQQLDPDKSIYDNVAEGRDTIESNGKTVYSYLKDFLFSSDMVRKKAGLLSGGEKNRVMLAKLFAKPANFLLLDEPTNDLDIETLELLENLLLEFQGTLIVISHDRSFLNNISTAIYAYTKPQHFEIFSGGYDDFERAQQKQAQMVKQQVPSQAQVPAEKMKVRTKLSYNEQRELQQLPDIIEQLEKKIAQLQSELADPSFYQKPESEIATFNQKLQQLEQDLEQKIERWGQLEASQN